MLTVITILGSMGVVTGAILIIIFLLLMIGAVIEDDIRNIKDKF